MYYRYMNFFLLVICLVSNDRNKDMKYNEYVGCDGVLIIVECWV